MPWGVVRSDFVYRGLEGRLLRSGTFFPEAGTRPALMHGEDQVLLGFCVPEASSPASASCV